MKDQPLAVLRDLVRRYGSSLAQDPTRCEGLLRDTCGGCNREIFVLVSAVRQHVPLDLLAPRHNLPLSLMKGFMAKRLQDELGLSDEAARWAVGAWADALGLEENGDGMAGPSAAVPGPLQPSAPAPDKTPAACGEDGALWKRAAEALKSGDTRERIRAVGELDRSSDPECIRLLVAALGNDRLRVREEAFDRIVFLSSAAVPALVSALNDPDPAVIFRAVFALAATGDRSATGPLASLLGRDPALDAAVIFALGEIGDPCAASPLSRYLTSPDLDLGLAAATALRKIGRIP